MLLSSCQSWMSFFKCHMFLSDNRN